MKADKTILQMKYARIVRLFAEASGMSLEDALSFFYDSDTYMLISQGIADMHCRSDEYLADELMLEYKQNKMEDNQSIASNNKDTNQPYT